MKFLKKLFCLKYEIDNKKYRRIINQHFRNTNYEYYDTITNIKAFRTKDKIIVEIETHRPGILIGKAGIYFKELKNYLKDESLEDVELHIKECRLWMDLY